MRNTEADTFPKEEATWGKRPQSTRIAGIGYLFLMPPEQMMFG